MQRCILSGNPEIFVLFFLAVVGQLSSSFLNWRLVLDSFWILNSKYWGGGIFVACLKILFRLRLWDWKKLERSSKQAVAGQRFELTTTTYECWLLYHDVCSGKWEQWGRFLVLRWVPWHVNIHGNGGLAPSPLNPSIKRRGVIIE